MEKDKALWFVVFVVLFILAVFAVLYSVTDWEYVCSGWFEIDSFSASICSYKGYP